MTGRQNDRAGTIDQTPQWQHITRSMTHTGYADSARQGGYPVQKARRRMLESLEQAVLDMAALHKAGLLTDTEAGLLMEELNRPLQRVRTMRQVEDRNGTGWSATAIRPVRAALRRISDRLPLLDRLLASGELQPAVMARLLGTVEKDLATLASDDSLRPLGPAELGKAVQIRGTAKARVKTIRERLRHATAQRTNIPEQRSTPEPRRDARARVRRDQHASGWRVAAGQDRPIGSTRPDVVPPQRYPFKGVPRLVWILVVAAMIATGLIVYDRVALAEAVDTQAPIRDEQEDAGYRSEC